MSTNMFLKLADITGESEDEKHSGEIEILGWGQSFEQPTTPIKASTGHTLEKCKHEPITITKYIDKATAALLKAIWAGKTIATGKITCYRAHKENAPVDFLVIEMTDVIITTYSISGAEGDIPQEELGLSYGKVKYAYKPMDKLTGDAKEPMPAEADLILNKVG
jgi:type VI secretion system secreted protein Hcp